MSTNVRFFLSHNPFKSLKTYFYTASYIFPRKCDVVCSNVITIDVICPPFVTTLFKRSGESKIDIALVHLCDFRHGVPELLDRRLCDKPIFYKDTNFITK